MIAIAAAASSRYPMLDRPPPSLVLMPHPKSRYPMASSVVRSIHCSDMLADFADSLSRSEMLPSIFVFCAANFILGLTTAFCAFN